MNRKIFVEITCPICKKVFKESNKNKLAAYRLGRNVCCSKACKRERDRVRALTYAKKYREDMKKYHEKKVIDPPKPVNSYHLTSVPRAWVPAGNIHRNSVLNCPL